MKRNIPIQHSLECQEHRGFISHCMAKSVSLWKVAALFGGAERRLLLRDWGDWSRW
jgi:hypothetical protein